MVLNGVRKIATTSCSHFRADGKYICLVLVWLLVSHHFFRCQCVPLLWLMKRPCYKIEELSGFETIFAMASQYMF